MSWPSRLRLALQLAAGSLVVHELRYRLGHEHGERSLTDHGHDYLTVLVPVVGLLLALASAHFLWAAWSRRPEVLGPPGRMTAWALAPALLAVHVGQEAIEATLALEQPHALLAILTDGGSVALALCGLVAVTLTGLSGRARRLARAVLERPGRRAPAAGRRLLRRPPVVPPRAGAPLSRYGAERAPPLLGS